MDGVTVSVAPGAPVEHRWPDLTLIVLTSLLEHLTSRARAWLRAAVCQRYVHGIVPKLIVAGLLASIRNLPLSMPRSAGPLSGVPTGR